MSFFDNVLTDMDNLEQEFLGPDYAYYKKVKAPSELGMSGKGNMKALASDVAGIVDYVELLVSGSGKASQTGRPLGNKFFLKTPGQCKDYKTNKLVTRSMYVDNVPRSNIPIISNLSGIKFPEFRGIVPGILEDIYDINPLKMFRAFMEGDEPICAEVTLPVIDANDRETKQSAYIPITELLDMQSDGKIPSSTVNSAMRKALQNNREAFINMCDVINEKNKGLDSLEKLGNKINIKKMDSISNIYVLSFSLLVMYLVYKLCKTK